MITTEENDVWKFMLVMVVCNFSCMFRVVLGRFSNHAFGSGLRTKTKACASENQL